MSHFVDTNIVVYAVLAGPKAKPALNVLAGATISVQVLNEFANVCFKKLRYDQLTLDALVAELRSQVATITPVSEETHDLARKFVFRYKLNFYDSALLASALLADCDVFYSEDLHPGLVIEDQLTIRNPFA